MLNNQLLHAHLLHEVILQPNVLNLLLTLNCQKTSVLHIHVYTAVKKDANFHL